MKTKWEAEWKGQRVYIAVDRASFIESLAKSCFMGLFGRAKNRCLLQYGNEIIERREANEPLLIGIGGIGTSIDLVGKAIQPDGQETHFHARIIPRFFGVDKCELKINYETVDLREIF